MGPVNGINPDIVTYFPLEEYVSKIRVNDNVLFHLEDTNRSFDEYVNRLSQYDDYTVVHHWIASLFNEINFSQKIEDHLIEPADMLRGSVFFDTLQMSHPRIKELHQFVLGANDQQSSLDYREAGQDVRVSSIDPNTMRETIYWRGAQGTDVKRFMDDFITIYKSNSLSLLNSNPFLKSSLVSLLFVRIHPFMDGNGRTSRMIYNIKFTDAINKIYNTKLKLCPLNLSEVIMMYRPTYVSRINDIYFDLKHDSNEEINRWFDFILTRADEAVFFNSNKLPVLERHMREEAAYSKSIEDEVNVGTSKMHLKKFKR